MQDICSWCPQCHSKEVELQSFTDESQIIYCHNCFEMTSIRTPTEVDDNSLDDEWFRRENPEFDEKLPLIAKDIVSRHIPYEDDELTDESVDNVITIMKEHLSSFNDMTYEELCSSLFKIQIACALCEINDVEFTPDGKVFLKPPS